MDGRDQHPAGRHAPARPAGRLAHPRGRGVADLPRAVPRVPVHRPRRVRARPRQRPVGRIWTFARDYPALDGPEASRPGTSPAPSGSRSTLGAAARRRARELLSEARVQPVDAVARLRLKAIWTVVGPFERLVGAEPLALAARRAENLDGGTIRSRGSASSSAAVRRLALEPQPPPRRTRELDAAEQVVARAHLQPALARDGDGQQRAGSRASPLSSTRQRGERARTCHSPPPARVSVRASGGARVTSSVGVHTATAVGATPCTRPPANATPHLATPPGPTTSASANAAPQFFSAYALGAVQRAVAEARPSTAPPSSHGAQYWPSHGTICAGPSGPNGAARPLAAIASNRARGRGRGRRRAPSASARSGPASRRGSPRRRGASTISRPHPRRSATPA